MAEQLLLKTQRNEIFQVLKQANLDPSVFEWQHYQSSISSQVYITLKHSPSDFYYQLTFIDGHWEVLYSPGQGLAVSKEAEQNWPGIVSSISVWAERLKEEIEAPDLWATITDEKAIVVAASDEEIKNTPFTKEEQRQITTKLNEVKAYLTQTQDFNEQQAVQVNRRLDYLADAATRMRRKDWLNLAVGVITGIAIQLFFQPTFIHELFQFIGNIFKPFLGGFTPLP